MMLNGRIFKEGTGWSAHCEVLGLHTQGRTRTEALANLKDLIEARVEAPGFEAQLTNGGPGLLVIESDQPARLIGALLRYQRDAHGLTVSQVAKRLGSSNHNAYAAYERGEREPSVSKFRELLAVVAPQMTLTLVDAEAG